ncbi:hypothetical protein ACT4RS_10360 [Ornithobacterium rhinotracheale]|uniref:hypothetical protein n=1 Tax=Ornithobacterium rhinotracheale TaxID=28251 RepID=UPI00403683EE
MPYLWINNKVAVEWEELVPKFWNTFDSLRKEEYRNRRKPYGIKKLQSGGNGRKLLIDFDTLSYEIQEELGDPRKEGHLLEKHYQVQDETIRFYAEWQRPTGHLTNEEQHQYVINATTWQALLQVEQERLETRVMMNKRNPKRGLAQTLWNDAMSFNETLVPSQRHSLQTNFRRFKEALSAFKKEGLVSVIKDPYGKGKQNRRRVFDKELALLKSLFAKQTNKPTPTEIYQQYEAFLAGYIEVFNPETGELYNPKDYPELSESTITAYLSKWENKIGTHALRSGNRQTYKQAFIPHAQMELPKYAGSLLSIDDRQPPFWYAKGKRMWFYLGLDVASGCFTAFVYGKSKEGIILEFYRQLVRNYHEWGFPLPYELECESSLNSSFTDTFLKEGYMFQSVRMEANNAQGKIIERRFGSMRYEVEKKAAGWIARPHAKKESNQAGKGKTQIIPYNDLVAARLADIEDWNNQPHHEEKNLSRFEYFLQRQKEGLPATNYKAILPYIGYKVQTSCRAGYIRLQGLKRAIAESGKILTGDALIDKMKQIEGKDVEVYWLDDNEGNVLKAFAYYKGRYICEVMEMPKFQRAKAEQTEQDLLNKALQDAYSMAVVRFAQKQSKAIEEIGIVDNTPRLKRVFKINNLKRYEAPEEETEVEIIEELNEDDEEIMYNPSTGTENTKRWKSAYIIQ